MEKPSLEDFDKICRFCLTITPKMIICQLKYQQLPLSDILRELFGIEVHPDDDLPQNICPKCIYSLIRCHNFKDNLHKSLRTLQNAISSTNSNPIKNEQDWSLEEIKFEIDAESTIENNEQNSDSLDEAKINPNIAEEQFLQNNSTRNETIQHNKRYKCSCGKIFESKDKYSQHREAENHVPKSLTKLTCKICNKTYKYHYFQQHMITHRKEKPFQCRICLNRFTQKGHLKIHMLSHSGEKPYSCAQCDKSFSDKYLLKKHQRVHIKQRLKPVQDANMLNDLTAYSHSSDDPLSVNVPKSRTFRTCNICNRAYKYHYFLQHMVTHRKVKPFQCGICLNRFTQKGHMKIHMLSHSGEKPYSCAQCDKSFSDKYLLKKHQRVHIKQRLKPIETFPQDENISQKTHDCEICFTKCETKTKLDDHMLTHIKIENLDQHTLNRPNEKDFEIDVESTNLNISNEKNVNADAESKINLNNEQQLLDDDLTAYSHSSDDPLDVNETDQQKIYECKVERKEKPFQCKQTLVKGTETVPQHKKDDNRLTEPSHLCDISLTEYDTNTELDKHMLTPLVENKDFPHKTYQNRPDQSFECKTCSKRFKYRISLAKHIETHNADYRTFLCPHCGDKFTQGLAYRKHLETSHDRKPDQGFQCQHCFQFYPTKYNLQVHMLRHFEKKVLCSHCGNSFYTKSDLKRHFDIHHAKEKAHSCSVCGKVFKRGDHLKLHMLVHTGVKSHCCQICSKRFARSSHLGKHLRTHTGEKPFVCSYCGRSFPRSCSLKVHLRTHTGERPYVCDVCSEGFYDSTSLKRHKMRHS